MGANRLLSYIPLLDGTELLMGLWQPGEEASSDVTVGLYVNRKVFCDAAGVVQPVWAVITQERSTEDMYVTVLATSTDAEAAYRSEILERVDETFCEVDHFWGESCDCDDTDLDERITRRAGHEHHRMLCGQPEALCMCGKRLHNTGQSMYLPTLFEHIEEVMTGAAGEG